MISIIIPCYNCNDVINDAIESCFNQEGINDQDLEIIVIDDNSDQPVSQYIHRQSNITCLRNSSNQGPAASRNVGIRASKGEFIAFLDADDLMINDRLRKQMDFLIKHDLDFAISAILERGIDGNEKPIVFNPPRDQKELITHIFLDKIYSITPTIFFNKSILEDVGYMDESLRHFEDKDFLLCVAQKRQIGYIREPLLLRRVLESGISRSVDEAIFFDSRKFFLKKAINRFGFLKNYERSFWAIQLRGFGRLSLLANKPGQALRYFLRSLRSRPNLKSIIYLISIFIPFLRNFLLKK